MGNRINMGAYGGTEEATSKYTCSIEDMATDYDCDGVPNDIDLDDG